MKKGEVIAKFIETLKVEKGENFNNTTTKELFSLYNSTVETEYKCSEIYFKNQLNSLGVSLEKTVSFNLNKQTNELVETSSPVSILEKIKKSQDVIFDDNILNPIQSGTIIDEIFSYEKGIMPATLTLIPGESGAGKTTVGLHLLNNVKQQNPDKKIGFISSEMNQIHFFKYNRRLKLNDIDTLMLSESETPYKDLCDFLNLGWDIILIDSLADTINKVRDEQEISEKKTEKMLLILMDKIRRGNNLENKYTSFLCTHHITKSGTYAGSTNLKHMTDAMMLLIIDQENPNNDPYMVFVKNRDGKTRKRLFYKITDSGIEYNEQRFRNDENTRNNISKTNQILQQKEENFINLFGMKTSDNKSIILNDEEEVELTNQKGEIILN